MGLRVQITVIGTIVATLAALLNAGVVCAQPKAGLTCLLVNKNSGRCLSLGDDALKPGSWIVQGPMLEDAGPMERWTLLPAGDGFRVRNNHSRLVMEIGSANMAPGVRAVQWRDQVDKPHQHWAFEANGDEYTLRAEHSKLVLCIGEGSLQAGREAIQWHAMAEVSDQHWLVVPVYKEKYWAFKDQKQLDDFDWIGPNADDCVKLEPAGVRVTLPVGHAGRRLATGIAKNISLKGDFEVTVGFDLLAAPMPADAGLFVGVDLVTERNRATFTRGVRERHQLTTWFELSKPGEDKPFQTDLKSFPTNLKSGQLRITRQGAELLYDVAEPGSVEFKLVHRHPFSEEEVRQIRIGGSTGGEQAALDARFLDLRVRAPSLQDVPAPAAVVPVVPGKQPDAPKTASSRLVLLVLVLALGMAFTVVLAAAAWFVIRQRRSAVAAPGAKTAAKERAKP